MRVLLLTNFTPTNATAKRCCQVLQEMILQYTLAFKLIARISCFHRKNNKTIFKISNEFPMNAHVITEVWESVLSWLPIVRHATATIQLYSSSLVVLHYANFTYIFFKTCNEIGKS